MKLNKNLIILLGFIAGSMIACKKDFLDRNPQTSINEKTFFQSPADLETYTNGLYSQLQISYEDLNSDNISSYSGNGEVDVLVRGGITPANVGGWGKSDWDDLRQINYMLDKVGTVKGDAASINHFVGIARFFRGLFYFNKIKRYSDVPWYSSALTSDDQALFKPQDPRKLVVDSVLADLTFAADNIRPDGSNTRITKWAALTLLARFALYEGTYRKYHEELNLSGDFQRFLDIAVSSTDKIIAEGGFSVHNTGKGGEDYRSLFSSGNLSGNKEMILWADFSKDLGVGNNSHTVLDWTWALSRSLANSYLKSDGTPFTSMPDHDKKTFTEIFKDRDPRMAETIMYPGFTTPGNTAPFRIKPTLGGLIQIKFYPRSTDLMLGWEMNYTDLPIYRYAEVLLISAEAKAESGTITQSDLDKTVNLLRSRVKMPNLVISVPTDPALEAMYPNAIAANKAILLEIRRERRVEMACEGLRYDDLMRWKSGKLLGDSQQGIYVPALGAMDVTGDGIQDIAILASENDESPIANLPDNIKNSISKFYLKDKDGKDQNFYLSGGTSGFVMFTRDKNSPRNFIEPMYYYRPIPLDQIVLNPNLKQPFGWK